MLDLNTVWLKLNYFGLTHKQDFRKWYIILLIALTVFIVVFAITSATVYLVDIPRRNNLMLAMASSQVDYSTVREINKPVPLELNDTVIIPSGVGRFDLITKAINSNKSWIASSVDYTYSFNGQEEELSSQKIMNGQEAFLTSLNVSGPTDGGELNVSMSLQNVEWRRIVKTSDLPRVDFGIDNIAYSSASAGDVIVHRVRASITNNSHLGFWQTKFVVLLYSGSDIVGVNYAYFDNFQSDDTKSLSVQWDRIGGAVSGVAILPEIDLLDLNNIMQ